MASAPPIVIQARLAEPFGARLTAALPPGAAGRWVRFGLGLRGGGAWWAKLELTDRARGQVVREVFLGPGRAQDGRVWRRTLVHVPQAADAVSLLVFGDQGVDAALALRVLGRAHAAAALLWYGWRGMPAALAGQSAGAAGRLRAVVGQAPARAGEAPPYGVWLDLFGRPPVPDAAPWDADILIVAGADAETAASHAAAIAQTPPARAVRILRQDADWRAATAPWAILLEAGEILATGAVAAFARAASDCPGATCITADCDRIDAAGTRFDPLFKPGPDPLLLASGLPVRGACALRWRDIPAALPAHAQAIRHTLAMQQPDRVAHIPRILSHIRPGTRAAPAVTIAPAPDAGLPSVTILIPTAARAAHVARCIGRVARGTDYPGLRIRVAVTGAGRPAILRRLVQLPGVAIAAAPPGPFNYARVNNAASGAIGDDCLLLMNDDVAPIGPGWLRAMAAHLQDPAVGIVGARLLYGNGMVQHEGVIMGFANLCEHAGRLRRAADPGPHGMAMLDRQVSAVTGACLLIRTALFRALGGMDEAYAVALNDVDLCLRARALGWRVVYCARAALYHFESLSLGRHYSGARAALEGQEVRRLRSRFGNVIAADPCYSPLASLQPGREWQPAFPPRAAATVIGPIAGPAAGLVRQQ